MKSIFRIYFLLLYALLALGCAPNLSPIVPTQTDISPVQTAWILQTPFSTTNPIQVVTSTSSTMESEQTEEIVKAYLHDPTFCELPCFLNIIPGKTTYSEAKDIFLHIGLPIDSDIYEGKGFLGTNYEIDNYLSIRSTLAVSEKIVEYLRINITPKTPAAGSTQEWLAFSPETLINKYGSPSRVGFIIDLSPRTYFEMDIYFEEVDLVVAYIGHDLIPRQKGSPLICPLTDQFENIRIWMGENPVDLRPPAGSVSLEKATSISIEEFSNLMLGGTADACFVINKGAYP